MATTNKISSSCSSIPSMKPNPNARNSESKDPMRRSFTGNPFVKPSSIVANSRGGFNPNTPANSPSDFPRRSSFGRENSRSMCDFEDKENSKGSNLLRPGRVQSPASVSKGTKNFMSPTVSAASKFTTSPRKKILVEKNGPLRPSVLFSESKSQVVMKDTNVKPESSSIKKKSVSFSDAISMLIEDDVSKPEMGLDEKKIEASHDSTITDMSHNEALKSDSGFDSEGPLYLNNDETGLDEKKIEASHDSTITDMGHNEALTSDSGFDSEGPLYNDVGSSWETVNLHPAFEISPRTSCSTTSTMLAPLDEDPLMPPYDPKTNYLSPRPQFLHYKPNPRIELMHCKDRDGKRLEESFISEILSDSEASESLSEDSPKESEDVSSIEMVKEEESVEEEELNVSAMIPISTHKLKSRFLIRSMFVALLLALMFVCLSISVTDSPVNDLSMLKDVALSNLYVPTEITEFAKLNFEELVRKSRLWAINSFSYAWKLISELRGVHKLGPLQYGNLTSLLKENHLVDGYPKFGHSDAGSEFKFQAYMLAPIREMDVKVEPLAESLPESEANEEDIEEVSEEDNGAEFEEQVLQDTDEVHGNIEEVVEDHIEVDSKEACVTPPAEEMETVNLETDRTEETTVESYVDNDAKRQNSNTDEDIEEVSEEDNGAEFEEQVRQDIDEVHGNIEEVVEDHIEVESKEACVTAPAEEMETVNLETDRTEETTVESYVDNDAKPQNSNTDVADQTVEILEGTEIQPQAENVMTTKAEENTQNTELDASRASATVENYLTKNVLGISSLVLLSLFAATTFFIQTKKANLTTSNATAPVVPSVMTKKLDDSPISVSAEHTLQEKPAASRNWQTEVDDIILGESCPSEMSSFKSSSSHSKGLKASSEAQSHEMKHKRSYRRESLASSDISLSSYSYGSFTTYEKMSSKHGDGDDEVVTPVRRSSRIRKQVTSP